MDHQNKSNKLGVGGIFAIIINVVIGIVLIWNFSQLLDIHAGVQTAIKGSIISDNPTEFINAIKDNDVKLWMWCVNVLAIVLTLGLLAGLTVPRLAQFRLLSLRLSYIWLLTCLTFLVVNIVRTVLALNHLFSP